MKIGTPYFASMPDAVNYYRNYGEGREAVKRKLEAGEIHLGKPSVRPGERLSIEDGRYIVHGPSHQQR
jgi:hypothetical protein